MKLALVQQRCSRDRTDNVERGLQSVRMAAADDAEVVAFAELAFEWFHPQKKRVGDVAQLAETVPGPTTDAFSALARELGVVILINLYERDEDGRLFDCSPVIDADGNLLGRTRMIHITDYDCFHERDYYHPGDCGAPVYSTSAGRIGIAICYDRHFPEYMRALALQGAQLVVVPQAGAVGEWPDGLYEAEIRVASFQNGYFAALCNRVGKEDCLTFAGESFVTGPDGTVMARAPGGTEHILLADLDLDATASSHARTLFLPDRRPELYGDWLTPGPGRAGS
ncbi:MAG: nitrilase-related carbon-nitrogen hydrolase [Planctomycetota bacterium]|jgi:N-carbamoylputrescine amidase